MPVPLLNFPASAIVDGISSYLQFVFADVDTTPSEYRWSEDDRASRIRISAPFVIDNEKPMSAPFVVIERGPLQFANKTIDNIRTADPNTHGNKRYVDWMDGYINIICGSGVAGEASSLANFIAILVQSNRSAIMHELKFLRNFKSAEIGPEVPVVKDTEVRRWEVTLRFFVSLQIGWNHVLAEPILWTKAAIYSTDSNPVVFSDAGETVQGLDTLFDSTKNFGLLNTNDPQLLQKELERGWYYIRFKDNEYQQLYTITEIIDSNTLRLQTHDENNQPVPWSAPDNATNLEYDLLWNSMKIRMELEASS